MKVTVKDAFNIPNILCYIRVLLIPVFMYFLITADEQNITNYYIAALLILISGLTDALDGFIARRLNMITELGKAIDPIADKLTQFAIAISLGIKFKGVLVLGAIVFVKELVMGIFCLVLLKQKKKLDGALWYGKVATWVYYVSMFLIVVLPKQPQFDVYVYILVGIASIFTLFSFVAYLRVFYQLYKK